MLAGLRRFLAPPVFENEEKTRVARLLNTVLLAFLIASAVITLAAAVFYVVQPDPETVFTLLSGIVMTVIFGGLLFLVRRGQVQLVSILFLSFTWILITVWIFTVSGISSDSSSLVYALLVVLAGLLLGGRAAMIMTGVSAVAVVGAYLAEVTGLLVVVARPISLADPLFVIIPLILTGVLLRYAMNNISDALERAQRNERAQIEANRKLELLRASLEQRVVDRTQELERRSVQLQVATEVSRVVTSILELEELSWQVAELIQDRFGLYHVGLFLLDEVGEWAVYRAGSGESGRELWERGFRLQVGGNSMVGWCTARAQPRIAQDVNVDAMYVPHELVPRTLSEVALPLIARGQVLGALSVQSDRTGTFDPILVAALQTMADQVAIAIDNARLYTESRQALEASRRAYGQLSQRAWLELLRSRVDWGYSFDQQTMGTVEGDWQPEMVEALQTGQAVLQGPEHIASDGAENSDGEDSLKGPALALPLKVRQDTIGVLGFYKEAGDRAWTSGEMELLQRMVDQLGAALESAQLYQDTQRRAAREQAIRQITERMRSAVEVETILQNTVSELAKALGVPRAYVRLGTEAELLSSRGGESRDGHSPSDGDSLGHGMGSEDQ
ncbi:MAG: GAF domain-containing protein [Anaerolineae bacterium]|jgi:GAF domain-containing protein